MNKTLILAVALLTLPAAALAQAIPKAAKPEAQRMIRQEDRLDVTCRGGPGDKPSTLRACHRRDRLLYKIQRAGWCWGHDAAQMEAEKQWEPCTAKNREP